MLFLDPFLIILVDLRNLDRVVLGVSWGVEWWLNHKCLPFQLGSDFHIFTVSCMLTFGPMQKRFNSNGWLGLNRYCIRMFTIRWDKPKDKHFTNTDTAIQMNWKFIWTNCSWQKTVKSTTYINMLRNSDPSVRVGKKHGILLCGALSEKLAARKKMWMSSCKMMCTPGLIGYLLA